MKLRDLIVMVAALEFGLHYFPWRILIGRELPRLAAYTLGLLGMMVPFSVWLMDKNEIEILQTLWTVVISAGITVFALYGLDRYLNLERREVEASQIEAMLKKLLKETGNEQGK
jgi:hypothetical protein